MNKKTKNIILSAILFLMSIIFTILVIKVDVQPVGVNNSNIGFATINKFFENELGTNMTWYKITEILGYLSFIIVLVYACIGLVQLIKRKSLFKIDKEIIILGVFYIIVLALYVVFDKIVINYRPVLVEGVMESSYPSSHTLMAIFIYGSSILLNEKIFNKKNIKILNIISLLLMLTIVIGRLLSGMHWFTDIIGGVIISSTLLSIYNLLIKE